jgi:histidinol-phosphate aminotransferase
MADPVERLARPQALTLPSYHAGMAAERVRERYGVAHVAKLASNENPCGASPAVSQALASLAQGVAIYPDADSTDLRHALASLCGVSAEHIVCGNGSENLIELLCLAFINPGDRVVSVTPSFGLHEICPRMMGAEVQLVPVNQQMEFDLPAMIDALQAAPAKMLMFSNPSNPVGCMLGQQGFETLINAAPADCLLVIDEAYYEYAAGHPDYPDSLAFLAQQPRPWIVLRTFSKAYGLAGLRVGYGLCCSATLASLLNRVRGPFNLNLAAQKAALAAVSDQEHVRRSVQHVAQERHRMQQALQALGLRLAPSQANLLFIDCGRESQEISEALLRAGIIIKGWREPGYTRWVRVSIGSVEDNSRFIQALSAILTT